MPCRRSQRPSPVPKQVTIVVPIVVEHTFCRGPSPQALGCSSCPRDWGIQARTSRAGVEQPQLIAHTSFPPRGAEGSSHAHAEPPPPPAAAARLQLPLQLVRVGARLSLLTCLFVCLLAYGLPAILPALLPAGGIAPEPEPVPAPPLTLENSTGSLGDNAEWSPPQK